MRSNQEVPIMYKEKVLFILKFLMILLVLLLLGIIITMFINSLVDDKESNVDGEVIIEEVGVIVNNTKLVIDEPVLLVNNTNSSDNIVKEEVKEKPYYQCYYCEGYKVRYDWVNKNNCPKGKSKIIPTDCFDNLTEDYIIDSCDNLGIEDSTYCVQGFISDFFKYRLLSDSRRLSFKELRDKGGDCVNWARFWSRLMGDYGFDVKTIKIDVTSRTSHIFIIASDKTGYCKLDQENVNCVMYG